MPDRRRFVRRCSLDQPVAFLRERRVGFASASTVGASTLSAAADVLFLFSQASWTFAAMRPRVDTAKPLAAAHSRIAVVSWRSAGDVRAWCADRAQWANSRPGEPLASTERGLREVSQRGSRSDQSRSSCLEVKSHRFVSFTAVDEPDLGHACHAARPSMELSEGCCRVSTLDWKCQIDERSGSGRIRHFTQRSGSAIVPTSPPTS
jgi:hypothetical protein